MNKYNIFLSSLIIFLSLFSLAPSKVFALDSWEQVGAAGFTAGGAGSISLAFDNGTLYVAYQDVLNDYKASVMKFDGTNWVQVGNAGFTPGNVAYTSLYIYNGTLYVAYADYANDRKASVMKFDGTNWVQVGNAGFSIGEIVTPDLVFDGGTPYIVYTDYMSDVKATVMKFNGADWELVGIPGFTAGEANYPSLAFDNGTPYVAYADYEWQTEGKASVMKFTGTIWEQVGTAGFTAGTGDFTSLSFNNGTPYVAYVDSANGSKASVMKFNGTSWEQVGTAGFTVGGASNTSLSFDEDTPFVAYKDNGISGKASVMNFNGTSWEQVGIEGFTAGIAGNISFAINNGTPYVGYTDGANGNKASVMRFGTPASPNTPPTATVSISGSEYVGNTLTGSYTYEDEESDEQGTSTYRWLRDNVAIDGQTSTTYTTTNDDLNKTIKFEVTPVASTGELTGTPVQSSGILIKKRSSGGGSGSIIQTPVICPFGHIYNTETGKKCTVFTDPIPQNNIIFTRTLKRGISGEDVRDLQIYLNTHNYASPLLIIDGVFGLKTKASVILFQKSKNLTPDGSVGPITRSEIK